MPIDTRAERMSILNFGNGSGIHLLPDVSGSFDQGDRQTLLDLYRGILSATSVAGGQWRFRPHFGVMRRDVDSVFGYGEQP